MPRTRRDGAPPDREVFSPLFYALLIASLFAFHRYYLWGLGPIFFNSRYRGTKPPEVAFWLWLLIPLAYFILWVGALVRFRKRRLVLLGLLSPVIALGILYCLNSQWHKFIYIAKCYWIPVDWHNEIGPPYYHTGRWRTWHPNGQLQSDMTLRKGLAVGTVRRWHPNGRLRFEGTYIFSEDRDACETWREVSSRDRESWGEWYHANWVPHGLHRWWSADGELVTEECYDHGNLLRRGG